MSLLRLEKVRKAYRRGGLFGGGEVHEVLRGVDLELHPGECLGLVGRSGCGKSTLGRVVLGLERPDAGSVRFRGREIASLRGADWRAFRRRVQVVFQNFVGAVNPRLTAGEIVAEPLRNFEGLAGAALERRVVGLLEMVGLEASDARKLPGRFSGGQLQRVCIARAVAPEPEVLVLDESVSSLDMQVQGQILDLLEHLGRERGLACLFISHDLRVVSRLCTRLAVMQEGVLEHGSGAERGEAYAELARAVLPARPS
ncbi:Nickel import ATP-binding protein NikE [Fundidesulfovibrio magnetotacticus]|uniref:Nickel import ATP-binding protein NikE n=1 Tax=Fundidesulfovibrio magnetotacticus TaxID=2730080 RepID=A0A6V8LIU6_9BACT|nr:ATP-binding cassette domain-containing protein [Fundidesulfovibrio magnetotacticus]GFK92643.1 Nickel import ATP-binding protein NikE [Fundidesulfovibrio magnetotacticus]